MGIPYQNSLQSKADQTAKISKSVYVSNFPEGCSSKDLWKVCSEYGTVVDVFIPNKKSKVGKRFAFVRFIKVFNLDRLIQNLNTIWIGRFHLFANLVHFERPKKPNLHPNNVAAASNHSRGVDYVKGHVKPGSFANIVSGHPPVGAYGPSVSSLSALVLDETCAIDRDLSNNFIGNVKDVSSISNLRALIMDEGFSVGNLIYLGSMWVMIECENVELKTKMMQHTGVKSWFQDIHNAILDFVSDERIVWVDIEGIPLNVWSRETFKRIGKKWGDVMDIEDNVGKIFMVRAKELFTWSPVFLGQKEGDDLSDDDSDVGSKQAPEHSQFGEKLSSINSDSDIEEVSETVFGDNSSIPVHNIVEEEKQQSEDPFNIYRILRKQPGGDPNEASPSLSHPPGFTLVVSVARMENDQLEKEVPDVVSAKVMNNSQ
ncbi:RNA-directed DNA polymerase, eukaryota, partial [Tanacetum coccineum]